MRKKSDAKTPSDPSAADADTRSFGQQMGTPDAQRTPERRNERMPHERDESARATGTRQQENPAPSDRQIRQANEDIEDGRVDTDRRGVPNDVPKR